MMNASQKTVNVLVVDDSVFMRRVISDILNSSADIKVVGTAKNGIEALEKVKELNPDVITLDIEMPQMDGLKFLSEQMKADFYPVVMLSSLTKAGADETIKALELGAVDFIAKPDNLYEITNSLKNKEIIDKVRMAGTISKRKNSARNTPAAIQSHSQVTPSIYLKKIVAIGTSTGGPKALHSVIPKIPGDISAAILVVQHMPPNFTKSLAERLNTLSELSVKEAEDGDIIQPGYAYIAPGDYHMRVEKGKDNQLRIKLSQDKPVGGHRPAVNVMMTSLSDTGVNNVIGVILTGMGADGSEGIVKLKKNNRGYIIAQDEASSVIYGMPRAAYETGVVDMVLPLDKIPSQITKIVGGHL